MIPSPSSETGTRTSHHRPRSRRILAGFGAAVLSLGLLAGCISEDQATVQNQVNASRSAAGRSKLADFSTSDAKAQAWAEHMAAQGTISHSNLTDGYQGVAWCGLAENVGMGPNLQAIHDAFMASSGHRTNIMGNYDRIGTGVVKKGSYYFVVHEFFKSC